MTKNDKPDIKLVKSLLFFSMIYMSLWRSRTINSVRFSSIFEGMGCHSKFDLLFLWRHVTVFHLV